MIDTPNIRSYALLFVASLFLSLPLTVHAQEVPHILSYQGFLEQDGAPVNDEVAITFRLHAAPEGNDIVGGWQENQTVDVINGVFSVMLGDAEAGGNPLPEDLADEDRLYLGISIGGEEVDRVRMTSTVFAIGADRARSSSRAARADVADEAAFADMAESATQAERAETADRADVADLAEAVQDNAVDTDAMQDRAVTSSKIGTSAVTASKISDTAAVKGLRLEGEPILTNQITLLEGNNVTLEQENQNITINARTFSSARYKEAIKEIEHPIKLLQALRGVRYEWRKDGSPDIGLIAEEVAEVLPEIVGFNDAGEPDWLDYPKLVAVLIEAAKEQQDKVDELERRIQQLEQQINQPSRANRP